MENLILLLATSLVARFPSAKKLKSHVIGNTGCSALLLPHARGSAQITDGGDCLYLQEFEERKVGYGMICVQLNETYAIEEATYMLNSYMSRLREAFGVLHQTGAQPSEDWNSTATRALVDYWQDVTRTDWKVKGYTNGRVLSVLYVRNISQADVAQQERFLDSFHFGF